MSGYRDEQTDRPDADKLRLEIERLKARIRRDEVKWREKLEEAKRKGGQS